MKKFITLASFLALLTSCGGSSDKGELVGVKGKKWHPEKPFGMTLIPGGEYIMGKYDDDPANMQDSPTKTVTHQNKSKSITETNDETGLTNNKQVVLTHFIDGYVIKESSKPFPVKSSNSNKQTKNDNKNNSGS